MNLAVVNSYVHLRVSWAPQKYSKCICTSY